MESRRNNLGLKWEVGARKIQPDTWEEWRVSQKINNLTGSLVIGQDIGNKWTHGTDRAENEMRGSTGKEKGISTWNQRQEIEKTY